VTRPGPAGAALRWRRHTLAAVVECSGVGVHTGATASVCLHPAPFGQGLTWSSQEAGSRWPVDLAHARAVAGATQLWPARDGSPSPVSTPEHLLAALTGMGVSDTHIVVDGPELPALDGAAAAWVDLVEAAGRVQGPPRVPVPVRRVVEVTGFGGRARIEPGRPERVVHVDFGSGGPVGTARWAVGDDVREVAWARTFVLAEQVDALRAAGRGRGATAANTLVWGRGTPRRADEPVVHKLLDLLGDLALVGPIDGRVEVWRGSHRLHHRLLHAWRREGSAA